MAQVAISVSDRDRAAVVAAWGIELKTGELFFASHRAGVLIDVHGYARPMQQRRILFDDPELLGLEAADFGGAAAGLAGLAALIAGSARPAVAAF